LNINKFEGRNSPRTLFIGKRFCKDNYFGEHCEYQSCNNQSFYCDSNRGECGFNECKCREGLYGKFCDQFKCFGYPSNDTNACGSNGYCFKSNYCICNHQYYGMNCELPLCYGEREKYVCHGNGKCLSPDKCGCSNGFKGEICETYINFDYPTQKAFNIYAVGNNEVHFLLIK
jgi:hypothetical protein